MKNKFQTLMVMGLSVILFSACSNEGDVETQAVMDQFEKTIATIDSGDMTFNLKIDGQAGEGEAMETISMSGDIEARFDRADTENPQTDLTLAFSLDSYAAGQNIAGGGDIELLILGKELLFRINALDLNHPQFIAFKPLLSPYFNQWLRLGEEMLPPELRNLQLEGQEAAARRAALQEFFENVDMFKVIDNLGMENLDGREVYHYEVEVDRQAFEEYLQSVAQLDGLTLTPEELTQGSQIVESIDTLEFWIDSQTYHLAQASLLMNDFPQNPALPEQNSDVTVELFMTAKPFNQPIDIDRPEVDQIQNFDPTALLLGGAAFSAEELAVPEGELPEGIEGELPEGLGEVSPEDPQNAPEDEPATTEENSTEGVEAEEVEVETVQ